MKSWAHYHPHLPELIEDPYPAYAWLRENAPVKYIEAEQIWALSRYDDIRAAVRNPDVFSNDEGVGYARAASTALTNLDHPLHTRLRRHIRPHFLQEAVLAAHSQRAQALMDELLDAVIDREADLAKLIAMPFLSRLVCEWMGIPACDRAFVNDGATAGSLIMSGGGNPEAYALADRFGVYFQAKAAQIEAIRDVGGVCPARNLSDLLFTAGPDGQVMTHEESLANMQLVAVGGNETTGQFLSAVLLFLSRRPDVLALIRAEPERAPALVEELLRHLSPVQGLFRNTKSAVTVRGVEIPAGAKVLMLYASGNHDPHHYPDPDVFQPDRYPGGAADADHLSFANGRHVCLGQYLARLVTTVLLRTIAERVEAIEITGPPVRSPNALVSVYESLPARLVSRKETRLAS